MSSTKRPNEEDIARTPDSILYGFDNSVVSTEDVEAAERWMRGKGSLELGVKAVLAFQLAENGADEDLEEANTTRQELYAKSAALSGLCQISDIFVVRALGVDPKDLS